MRVTTYVGTAVAVLLLIVLLQQTDLHSMWRAIQTGGWSLAWLLPYRSLFFAFYALGWLLLLGSAHAPVSASFVYTFWVTSVREAVDRLLPVASVGGGLVGLRLMRWWGLDAALVGASIITEIALTLVASYVFAAMGLVLLAHFDGGRQEFRSALYILLCSLPVPVAVLALIRQKSVFGFIDKALRSLLGDRFYNDNAANVGHQIRLMLAERSRMSLAGGMQLLAMISGSFEIWLAVRLLGRSISVSDAVILESMTMALRHIAFIVPAGLGVQELGLVVFGQVLGIDSNIALAISMIKRARELLWGIPSLMSWQWLEGRRLMRISVS